MGWIEDQAEPNCKESREPKNVGHLDALVGDHELTNPRHAIVLLLLYSTVIREQSFHTRSHTHGTVDAVFQLAEKAFQTVVRMVFQVVEICTTIPDPHILAFIPVSFEVLEEVWDPETIA